MTEPQVHDLVRIDVSTALRGGDVPAWAIERLARVPWAVVRRERIERSVAIGIRGATRAHRFAATISPRSVCGVVTPWELDVAPTSNAQLRHAYLKVLEAARTASLRIAPVGSFGFELGCGELVTHDASDLDLIVDAAGVSREQLFAFRLAVDGISARSGVRVDAELSYPHGGVALCEALVGSSSVLFKTATGPMLLPCPI